MGVNIVEKYINIVQKELKTFIKLIYGNKYENKIFEEYFKKYKESRYYNYYEKNWHKNLRQTILETLKETQNELLKTSNKEIINTMCVFFYYMLYFDNVIKSKNIEKTIEKIAQLKEKIFKKTFSKQEFQQEFLEQLKYYEKQKRDLIDKYKTDEFYIKLSNYKEVSNVIRVNLKYNIKLPELYSEMAIHKAFNTGITNEDKLYVEYNLVSLRVLEDIQKQNFRKQYIVEFAETLLDKPKKMKSILEIINNPILQDKISLKIKYSTYISKSEIINELLRNGYKITVILDNTFKPNFANVEKLNMFNYSIVNKESKIYEEVIGNKDKIKKLIEI